MGRYERRVLLGAVIGTGSALGLLIALGFHASRPSQPPSAPHPPTLPESGPLAGVAVVLDPGHGGQDPGTTCGPFSEAALTYRIAAEIGASLRAQGAEVTYTVRSRQLDPALAQAEPPLVRPTDAVLALTGKPLRSRHSPLPLWQRAAVARAIWTKQVKWDPNARRDVFFLSLHFDQYQGNGISGSMVCVDRRTRRPPALSAALAGQMAQDGFVRHADYHGLTGVSGHALGVLNPEHNPVPEKALLELATLSNPQDARLAGDPVWREEMTRRITEAIILVHSGKSSPPELSAKL